MQLAIGCIFNAKSSNDDFKGQWSIFFFEFTAGTAAKLRSDEFRDTLRGVNPVLINLSIRGCIINWMMKAAL
jgi:hypothetical protein